MAKTMTNTYAIALDVGGTFIKSAVVASTGNLVGPPGETPINSRADAETILTTFTAIIRHHLVQVDRANLAGVAFGFSGPFDYEVGVSYISGLAKYEAIYGLSIKAELQARLDLRTMPFVFRNDAEAAIIGEACYGAGRPYHRLIGITLGTGFGSSFIVDGRPVSSGRGVPPDGWLFPVLVRGVQADGLFSRRGLEARLQAAGAPLLDLKEAAMAARRGDVTTWQVFEAFGTELGAFLEPFAVNFQAEVILVLGGIAGAFDLFGPTMGRALSVPVIRGQRGSEAALLGAAALLFKKEVK